MTECFIDAEAVTFNRLLENTLEVPFYQRPYTWQETQLKKLLTDLFSNPDGLEYYMGAIILHKDEDKHNIIDGQQRVITLLLLAKVLGVSDIEKADISIGNLQSQKRIKQNYQYFLDFVSNEPSKKAKLKKTVTIQCKN